MPLEQVHRSAWSPFVIPNGRLRAAARYGLAANDEVRLVPVTIVLLAITWAPLAILASIEGTAFAGTVAIPFFADHIPHGRFLIAAPLLLLLHKVVERRTARAMRQVRSTDLIAPEQERELRRFIDSAARAWRSRSVHIALIAVTCLAAVVSYRWWREAGISTWMFTHTETGGTLGMAGGWNLFVATPLVRLLFLQAMWKFAVWLWLLTRLRRLDLRIDPLHPDRSCGLLFLGEAQLAFVPLVAAFGVQLGCMVAVLVQHHAAELSSFRLAGAAFVALSVVMILGPLLMFAGRAWLAIERAQDSFSIWCSLAAERLSFTLAQAQREHMQSQLSTSEVSSIADGASLFDRTLTTSAVPFSLRQTLTVTVAAAASAILPLLALLPLGDIAERLVKILL